MRPDPLVVSRIGFRVLEMTTVEPPGLEQEWSVSLFARTGDAVSTPMAANLHDIEWIVDGWL